MVVYKLTKEDVQAYWDDMSDKAKTKYPFPIKVPREMTKEEKDRFTKAKRTVDRKRQYKTAAEDPEAHAVMQAKRKEKREEARAEETPEEAEERRKKWRQRANDYNEKLRKTDPEKYKEQWKRSNAARSSSSSSPQYKECPKCTVMIEHTGGCELISCPCGTHFSFKFPEIHGEDKDLVAEDIQRNRTNLWMKRDRELNPEKYKEKDKAKRARLMEDPEKAEKERERQRLKEQIRRASAEPEEAAAYNRERREIKRQRLTDGFKKCPICDDVHESKDSEFCQAHRKQQEHIRMYEYEVDKALEEWGFYPSLKDKKGPCGDSKNLRRTDRVFYADDCAYTILLEIDEDWHKGYPINCEVSKMADLRDQFLGKPLLFIRYGVKRRSHKQPTQRFITKASLKELRKTLEFAFSKKNATPNQLGYEVWYIGYPKDRIEKLENFHLEAQKELEKHFLELKREEDRLRQVKSREFKK